jgi:hypothetical protein
MKQYDRDNLKFLMQCPQVQFDAWMDEATDDDIDYALEIIRQAKAELMVEQMEIEEVAYTYEDDMAEAKKVLSGVIRK